METIKSRAKHSIIKRLSIIMTIGWLFPITIIYIFIAVLYQKAVMKHSEAIINENIEYISSYVSARILEAADTSRYFSYEGIIEDSWKDYNNQIITQNKLSNNIIDRLNINFSNDRLFTMSCFFLADDTSNLYYINKNPDNFNIYKEKIHQKVIDYSRLDISDLIILVSGSRIYLIRNMYSLSDYIKFGTLILELDTNSIFDKIHNDNLKNTGIFINNFNSPVFTSSFTMHEEDAYILDILENQYSGAANNINTIINTKKYRIYLYEHAYRDFNLGVYTIVNQNENYQLLGDLNLFILLVWVIVIPVVVCLIRYITKQISRPLAKITTVANRLKNGEIGVQVDGSNIPNLEFEELASVFNKASMELKLMIDHAYKEELAKKDAKIMALQSQINPHFLNNTLEMMNWQARLSGDITVSKMIEALSTFLDQSMDRANKRLVPLSEVIRCADAYFYIISMRFGKRLITLKEIDESLLTTMVPPLTLQPVLENAVMHGIEKKKEGRIWLKVFSRDTNLVMQVINTGRTMTAADIEKVNKILANTPDTTDETLSSHQSLGIRNVNERIKLIFGEQYGLNVKPYEEGKTIAEIIMPICMP